MGFLIEAIEEPVTHFQAEHEYAKQRISDAGVKNKRFVNEDNQSVMYLTSVRPILMNMDEIKGLIFFNSAPIFFSASRYRGHMATEIKLEKKSILQEPYQHEQEIITLIKEGLKSYAEWHKIAFWE